MKAKHERRIGTRLISRETAEKLIKRRRESNLRRKAEKAGMKKSLFEFEDKA